MVSPSLAVSTWAIDPDHSSVQFALQYMGIGVFSARFRSLAGMIHANETNPEESSVAVTIQVESIDVGNKTLYDWLVAPEFFNPAVHPEITFTSSTVRHVEESRWQVEGDLTIGGRTRAVVLDTVYLGQVQHPYAGRPMAAFTAETTLSRGDFGLGWNMMLENGAAALGEQVKVTIYLTAFRQD